MKDMPGEQLETKRPSVRARKDATKVAKGARRKARSGNGPRSADRQAYGSRTLSRGPSSGLSITVQIPPLRRPKSRPNKDTRPATLSRLRQPKRRVAVLAPLLLVVICLGIFIVRGQPHSGQAATAAAAETRTKPSYTPLVPASAQANTTQYDGKRNMVSYTTSFSTTHITVSQQALPATFAADGSALKRAADSMNATSRIDTNRGPAYVGTNEPAGDQLAIFAADTVLVLMHSDQKMDNASWKSFIGQLESKSWDAVQ